MNDLDRTDNFKHLCNSIHGVLGASETDRLALVVISGEGVYAVWMDALKTDPEKFIDVKEMLPIDISVQEAFCAYVDAPDGQWNGGNGAVHLILWSSWFKKLYDVSEHPESYPTYSVLKQFHDELPVCIPMHLIGGRLITDAQFFLEMSKLHGSCKLIEELDSETTQTLINQGKVSMNFYDDILESRGEISSAKIITEKMKEAMKAVDDIEAKIAGLEQKKADILGAF